MYRKKGRSWTKHIDFMLLDVLCMQIAFIVSYICRFGLNNPYIDKDYRVLAVAFLLIDFFVEIVSDAFKNALKRGYFDEFIATCKHVAFVEIIATFFLFTTRMGEIYSRMSYYIMIPIYILVSYLGRMVLKNIIKKRGFASSKKSLFVIAPEKLLEETLQGLNENGFGYTQIVAAATDADLKGKTICEIPIVANRDRIVDYACEEWVDEVLIPPCAESEYPYEMADIFLEMGIAVHRGITKNKVMAGNFNQIEKIGDYTVITASMNYASTTQLLAKRGMDILGGLVGCIITLIVTIFVGPAIYIASPGPIFFAQERIGRNGRKFKMYKFRSMYMDAEERKKELMSQNKVSDGMMFKMDFDPRIIGNKILPDGTKKTGIGQFIRKTSIDELPQFWNILKGDMSLVGTRPPTLDEWDKYEPHHRARMSFRPGLTGLWQVSGRSNITDFEEVVKLDTQYINEWSVKGDIEIIWQTAIGKPCDIEALINYTKLDWELKKCIKYTMTFFCAGAPSKNATLKLAENLGVQVDQIDSVRYRGNGWPGKATITLKDKSKRHMEYIDSWNRILGRNIRKMCKFCVNGVGMYADISCGDLWNLDQNQKPEFTEGKGQNIIFARSKAGRDLLIEASNKGYLYLENYTKMNDLKYIQPNHYNMQTTMSGKIVGMKIVGCNLIPQYNIKKLFEASKEISKGRLDSSNIGPVIIFIYMPLLEKNKRNGNPLYQSLV